MKTILLQIVDALSFVVAVSTACFLPLLTILYELNESGALNWGKTGSTLLISWTDFCVSRICPIGFAAAIYSLIRESRREKRSAFRSFLLWGALAGIGGVLLYHVTTLFAF